MTTQIRLTRPEPGQHRRRLGDPEITYRLGHRLTDCFEVRPDQRRRFVGTVTETDTLTFCVTWDGDGGTARYAHDHEPTSLRPATAADERAAIEHPQRTAIAAELRRQARTHPHWPAEVRRALTARATELTERP